MGAFYEVGVLLPGALLVPGKGLGRVVVAAQVDSDSMTR